MAKAKDLREQEEFVSALFERLCPGSLPGVRVHACNGNSFTLFAVTDDSAPPYGSAGPVRRRKLLSGEGYGFDLAVANDRPRSRYRFMWPREVRVSGIEKAWSEARPALLLAPRPISLRRLASEHGMDYGALVRAAYSALANRVNKLGATFYLMRPDGWGKGHVASFRCGQSKQEAELRLMA